MASKEQRLAELRESERKLEAQYRSAEQDNAEVAPEESSTEDESLTEETSVRETTLEPVEKPGDELAKLRKEYAELQHRYNRYKGSTDGTIFDLRKEVKKLTESLTNSRKEVSELRIMVAKQPDKDQEVFTQDVIDVLGEDTVNAIKASTQSTAKQLEEIQRKLDEAEQEKLRQKAERVREEEESDFLRRLEDRVPDFRELNKDTGFLDWLDEVDSDGMQRLNLLRQDQKRLDAKRVAEFFIEYKKVVAEKSKKKVKDSVKNHIGPTGNRSSTNVSDVDQSKKGTIKQSEINKYRSDILKGKYKFDRKAADQMENRIFKATLEDKIIFDEPPNR